MLTEETFIASIKHEEKHLKHVGDKEHYSINDHALETEETVINEL